MEAQARQFYKIGSTGGTNIGSSVCSLRAENMAVFDNRSAAAIDKLRGNLVPLPLRFLEQEPAEINAVLGIDVLTS